MWKCDSLGMIGTDKREMYHRLSVSEMHIQSPFFVGNLQTLTFARKNIFINKTLGFFIYL